MKKITQILAALCITFSATAQGDPTMTVNPDPFVEDQMMTITLSNFDPAATWGETDIYLWSWVQDGPNFSNNGMWEDSSEAAKLTNNMDGTYSISFVPLDSYENNPTEIGTINMIFKTKNGGSQLNGFSATSARVLSSQDFQKDITGLSLTSTFVKSAFSFTGNVKNVAVYNTAGSMIKSFKGAYSAGHTFDIATLGNGLFLVQATNNAGQTGFFKLMK